MFRSPRLEALFGKRLDQLTFVDVVALVGQEKGAEAADLDYKELVEARNPTQKAEFCKDVVAMANDRGGILLIGVKEDGARAIAEQVTKVAVGDAEERRLRGVLLNTAPHPLPVDIGSLEDPEEPGRGVLLVTVERSTLAPHAVLDTQERTHHRDGWLRFPIRNGAATRWMLEPELATRYRQRFTQGRDVADRLDTVEREALSAYAKHVLELTANRPHQPLGPRPLPVLTIALAPELPGFMRINHEVFREFQNTRGGKLLHDTHEDAFSDTWLAAGRMGGAAGGTATTRYGEFYTDGSGVMVFNLDPHPSPSEQHTETRLRLALTMACLLSGLRVLGRHAQERVAATGTAVIRTRLEADVQDAYDSQLSLDDSMGFSAGHSIRHAVGEATVFIDDVVADAPALVSTASILADQVANALGLAESSLFTPEGTIPSGPWAGHNGVLSWAKQAGVLLE